MKKFLFVVFAALTMSVTAALASENGQPVKSNNNDSVIEHTVQQEPYTQTSDATNTRNDYSYSDIRTNMILDAGTEMLAIVCVFGLPFIAILTISVIAIKNNTKRKQIKYDMVNKAIERGYQIPEYIFQEKENKNKFINTSVIFISIGLVLLILGIKGNSDFAIISIIPLMIGAGQIFTGLLQKRKDDRKHTDNKDDE